MRDTPPIAGGEHDKLTAARWLPLIGAIQEQPAVPGTGTESSHSCPRPPEPELSDEMGTLCKKCFKLAVRPHLDKWTLTRMVMLFDPSDCIRSKSTAGCDDQYVHKRRLPELNRRDGLQDFYRGN